MLLPMVLNSINPALRERYAGELLRLNEFTGEYGLLLSPEEAQGIIETRNAVLSSHGRVDLGIEVARELIKSFYSSSYINAGNYVSIINELQEIFYYMKNETEDLIADDRLIGIIRSYFENSCGGSIELLKGKLDEFAADFRRKADTGGFMEGEGE